MVKKLSWFARATVGFLVLRQLTCLDNRSSDNWLYTVE